MKAWTRARTLAAGATLIVLTNAAALAGAFLNRNAEAESRTTLSERELALPYGGYRQAENSGLALQLNWRVLDENPDHWDHGYARHGGQPAWLDAAHLATLGFDTTAGAATSEARQRFTRQLPRQVLLLLELEGPTWQQAVSRARENAARQTAAAAANPDSEQFAKQAEAGRARVAIEETHASRLFVIDAGLDADALRRRYPDRSRHLIVRGSVRPAERGQDGDHHLAGHISQIAIAQVNVPFALRPVLEPLRNAPRPVPDQQAPRYEVQLAIGQRLEPWIERVTTLPAH
ncbi:MAG: DUF4824 family protein [Candidatus Accumulibacter sp.]|nr:DUF4824 family protein [Candidatus Accumulibacter necessarius]